MFLVKSSEILKLASLIILVWVLFVDFFERMIFGCTNFFCLLIPNYLKQVEIIWSQGGTPIFDFQKYILKKWGLYIGF